ncbi:uncharacterized protein LOC120481870 [Pimephales promelas]|uniref:uncharacterized protein LOC120481870 n=1 Tax=Pimephales promelas TaxID=90988 RepID=UPI001955946F|nr:uncharacterized protein LOC120481870 [Pimephales promelas]
MTSPRTRTICFVYFALLFRTAHAHNASTTTTTISSTEPKTPVNTDNQESNTPKTITSNKQQYTKTTSSNDVSIKTYTTTSAIKKLESTPISQPAGCTQTTTASSEAQCLLLLPTGDILKLVVLALIVCCFGLLVTTLICICQVCHLRGIISSLQPGHNKNNIDLRAIREKSESPHWDEGQVDRQPTETCLMLSEVTTAQEERKEDEERVLENKDTEQPGTEKDPNGDITQENSQEPEAKAPESADTGV